jgi:hypothetical protein
VARWAVSACKWAGNDQPRVLPGRHGEECAAGVTETDPVSENRQDVDPGSTEALEGAQIECAGCQPCTKRHCGTCGYRHVAVLTCPECVGEARENIDAIVTMSAALPDEAAERGATSEAAMLEGPTAEPAAWRQRRRYGYRDGAEVRTKAGGIVGEEHPLWTLGTWDLLVTEHYGHHRTARITLATAASYLKANLSDLAQDEDFAFDDLVRDLRRCRTHLEAVLHDQAQGDRAGVGCFECGKDLERRLVADGFEDVWTCKGCCRRYTYEQYNFALRASLEDTKSPKEMA